MSHAYQVIGSEGGTIGTFASRKSAIEKAVEYVTQYSWAFEREDQSGNVHIEGNNISARVERLFLE